MDKDFDIYNSKDIEKLTHHIQNEKPYFINSINIDDIDGNIIFVKPKQYFERIVSQKGVFAIFGIRSPKNIFPIYINESKNVLVDHYIIPRKYKKTIKEELEFLGVNKASVYCDMDKIAEYYKDTQKESEKQKQIRIAHEFMINHLMDL